jgi:hypothetical protein
MTGKDIDSIVSALRKSTPPSNLSLLRRISSIDWDNVPEDDFEACSEIILRITADVIVYKFDIKENIREDYKSAFLSILNSVQESTLPARSEDFRGYFYKYRIRLAELE